MPTYNQKYWMQADWSKLAAYIANPENFPDGIVISHKYFEDIRKIIFLLNTLHAGQIDEEAYEFEMPSHPDGDHSDIQYYAGDFRVTKNDPDYGWLFWVNKVDITKGDTAPPQNLTAPPAEIHPATIWQTGNSYSKEDCVTWPDVYTGKAYRAKNDIVNKTTTPPDNSSEWFEYEDRWITHNDWWELVASPNYYYQYDKNAPTKLISIRRAAYPGTEPPDIEDRINFPAYAFLPKQVDPKEQFPPVIFGDTGDNYWQYKEKLKILKEIITGNLGTIWTSWRTGPGYAAGAMDVKDAGSNQNNAENGHSLDNTNESLPGNQYTNYYDFAENTPVENDEDHWTGNPKILGGSYQGIIEAVLSRSVFEHKANTDFETNWKARFNKTGEADAQATFDEYPSVNDLCWGENESGFEFLKKLSGKYDWYFDADHPYWPRYIVDHCSELYFNHSNSWDSMAETWDLLLAGTWRRTWKYSMGRVSLFMRSYEMGMTDELRREAWDPDASPPLGNFKSTDWFGARSKDFPAIDKFDTDFAEIVSPPDNYTVVLSGNYTTGDNRLGRGFMVHLCSGSTQLISGDGTITPAYIIAISYDDEADETTIRLSESVDGFNYIGWNTNISLRHDPDFVEYDDDELQMYYLLKADLVLEMMELIQPQIYREAILELTVKQLQCYSAYEAGDDDNGGFATMEAYVNTHFLRAMEIYNQYIDDPTDPIWGGWPNPVYATVEGSLNWNGAGQEEDWRIGPTQESSVGFTCTAIQAVWSENLKGLPKTVLIRLLYSDVYDIAYHYYGWRTQYPQSSDDIHNTIIDDYAVVNHYRYIKALTNGTWLYLIPDVKKSPYLLDPLSSLQFTGQADLLMSVSPLDDKAGVEMEWEDVIEDVFARSLIGHIDAAIAITADTNAPRPNPPVFHYDPLAVFEMVDGVEDPDDWVSGTSYQQNDYVRCTHDKQIYQASCNIVHNTYYPSNNPSEWQWVPPKFELYIKSESCLCEDYEGNTPIKYRMVCLDDEELTTEFLTSRAMSSYVKDVTMSAITLTGSTSNPSGEITRIPFTGSAAVDDYMLLKQCGKTLDGIQKVTGIGTGYVEIDTNDYFPVNFIANSRAYNISQIYDEDDWEIEDVADYDFVIQAKDDASPINNQTQISEAKKPGEPENWPIDLFY